jgi:uncharacterized OB-fold protein
MNRGNRYNRFSIKTRSAITKEFRERRLPFMKCPKCGCIEWRSVEKNEKGENVKVQCLNCGEIYETRLLRIVQ